MGQGDGIMVSKSIRPSLFSMAAMTEGAAVISFVTQFGIFRTSS